MHPLFILVFVSLKLTEGMTDFPCGFWDNAVYIKEKCYKAFTHEWLSWNDAQSACAVHSSGGRLAEPIGFREMNVLNKHISVHHGGSRFKGWIGAKRDTASNVPIWVHNSVLSAASVTVTPTRSTWGSDANCLMFYNQDQVTLSDCSELLNYVCEQDVSNPCDHFLPGAEYYQGQCFLRHNESKEFEAAKMICKEKHSFLAEPMTQELYNFVLDLHKQNDEEIWLGASGKIYTTKLKWVTAGAEVDTSLYDNSNFFTFTPCMGLVNGKTSVETCQVGRRPLCQRDIGNPCEEAVPGAVFSSKYCFMYFGKPASFSDAEETCRDMDGYLVEPRNDQLEQFLENFIIYNTKEHAVCHKRGGAPVWTGLTHFELDKSTRWRTDGALAPLSRMWPAWHNKYEEGTNHCAVSTSMGEWVQRSCNSSQAFVCQKAISIEQEYLYVMALGYSPIPSAYYREYHICVTTALTSFTSRLALTFFKLGVIREMSVGFVDKDTAYQKDVPDTAGYEVAEVKSTHPVTVTLFVSSTSCFESTLAYPLLQDDDLPEMSTGSYYVVASAESPRTSRDISNDLIIVATQEYATKLNITLTPEQATYFKTKGIGSSGIVHYTLYKYKIYKLTGTVSFDGMQVQADKKLVVYFIEMNDLGSKSSISLNQLPPLSFLSQSYITLPSSHSENAHKVGSMRVATTSSNAYVIMPFTMEEKFTSLDPTIAGDVYASYQDAMMAKDLAVIQFEQLGEVSSAYHASAAFVEQKGNMSFYSWQSFKLNQTTKNIYCSMTLIPQNLWRSRYAINVPTSQVKPLFEHVYLYLVVPTHLIQAIYLNGAIRSFTCSGVESTEMSGCQGYLKKTDYTDHLVVIEMVDTFAAYVMLISDMGQACHALGFSPPQEKLYNGPFNINKDTVTLMPPRTDPTISSSSIRTTRGMTTTQERTTSDAPTTTSTTDTTYTATPCPTIYPMLHTSQTTKDTGANGQQSTSNPNAPDTNAPVTNTPSQRSDSTIVETTTNDYSSKTPYVSNGTQCVTLTKAKTNLTRQETNQLVKDIQEALSISGDNTTQSKRKKSSAPDDRTSSTIIGVIGVCLFIGEVSVIVVPDIMNICKMLWP